jgi:phage tail protein X
MTITAYTDQDFQSQAGSPFVVWINPASYSHDYPIEYTARQAQGSGGPSPAFSQIGQDKVAFELIFDGTGVVPPPSGQTMPSNGVAGLVGQLQALIASYNGSIHRPNFVKLSWSQLDFQCVLESMNVKYTLFKPDGTPLRATVALSFLGFMSEDQIAKVENKLSPDLTHTVTVRTGDTLPALCYQIYGSSTYYSQVAAANNLSGFRQLRPGAKLTFPPLSGSAT